MLMPCNLLATIHWCGSQYKACHDDELSHIGHESLRSKLWVSKETSKLERCLVENFRSARSKRREEVVKLTVRDHSAFRRHQQIGGFVWISRTIVHDGVG